MPSISSMCGIKIAAARMEWEKAAGTGVPDLLLHPVVPISTTATA